MAASKYVRSAPTQDLRRYTAEELRRIQIALDTIVEILGSANVPIEAGPNDSAGAGYRTLRIPNA